MEDKKSIVKDGIIIVSCIIVILIACFGVSYSYFVSINKGEDNVINIGDLNVSFCTDETCKKDYANFGQVIGTKKVNGESVTDKVYPYENDSEALEKDPYIFNIKNTGTLKTFVTIRLKEDKDYNINSEYSDFVSLTDLYSNHIKIGISDCSNKIERDEVKIYTYGNLQDNVIVYEDEFNSGNSKTYCLWTWLDNTTPNEVQNTYFVANLDFKAEYKPNK